MWGKAFIPFTARRLVESEGKIFSEETMKNVVSEATLQICMDERLAARLLCLPQNPIELAAGYLYMEHWIETWEDAASITTDEEAASSSSVYTVNIRTVANQSRDREHPPVTAIPACLPPVIHPHTSSDQKPLNAQIAYPMSLIWRLVREFKERSELHRNVGGVHSALLYHPRYEVFREDFGRHNCLDRIAGHLLQQSRLAHAREGILLSSGRVSTEMLNKALRMGIPFYVSLKTPTDRAVEVARRLHLTLIGHADCREAILYAGEERVLLA